MRHAIGWFPPRKMHHAVVLDSRPAGVFATLAHEHREVTELMRRLLELLESDAKTRRNRWAEIERELLSHERAESLEVYRALEGIPSLKTITHEHSRHAHPLEALIDEFNAIPMHSRLWHVTFRRFQTVVKQHFKEEETKFFPRARPRLVATRANSSKSLTSPPSAQCTKCCDVGSR